MDKIIFHVATADSFKRSGAYYEPEGFSREGFIHACARDQLEGVLERYFHGIDDLYLFEIDVTLLEAAVKAEASASGELFPHIYGRINRNAIVSAIRIR